MENDSILRSQLCVITVLFPVDSDDEAIKVKKGITEIMSSEPNARIDFRLQDNKPPVLPKGMTNGA